MSVTNAGFVRNQLSRLNQTELAMIDHMAVAHCLWRPVGYYNLMKFEANKQSYVLAYGTVRNKISKLRKLQLIDDDCYFNHRRYFGLKHSHWDSMKGRPVTFDPTGYKLANNPIYRMVKDVPMKEQALHDIHLKTKISRIWSITSKYSGLPFDPVNKGIQLGEIYSDDLNVAITVEHNDTITATVACSYAPIVADVYGVMRLNEALARVEERLALKIRDFCSKDLSLEIPSIPPFKKWIVTMWHFGVDSIITYTNEKFDMTVDDGMFGLIHIYTKDVGKGKCKLRIDNTQKPGKSLGDALAEKIGL